MSFFLLSRTVPAGALVTDCRSFSTLEAALGAARARMETGDQMAWIVDHQERLVLSSSEVKQRLAAQAACLMEESLAKLTPGLTA